MSIQIHNPNLISTSFKKDDRKVRKAKFKKENICCEIKSKAIKVTLDLYYVKTKFIYKISSQNHKRQERKVRKTKFLQRAKITQLKVGQTRHNSNLTCITSRQIHFRNFNLMCRKMIKKSPEIAILAKGSNSCKCRSNTIKVKLDL